MQLPSLDPGHAGLGDPPSRRADVHGVDFYGFPLPPDGPQWDTLSPPSLTPTEHAVSTLCAPRRQPLSGPAQPFPALRGDEGIQPSLSH